VRLEAARSEQDPDALGAQDSTLRRNGARAARAVLTKGRTTVGTARPVVSASTPRA